MKKFLYFALLINALSLSFICKADGLTLGATRLIYTAEAKEASVTLDVSGDAGPFLVQAWISAKDGKDTPFIITPPIYKLYKNSNSMIRVVYIGGEQSLPEDRESLFFLNVKAIPAVNKEVNVSRVVISTQNIIKMIYRPIGLNSRDAKDAINKLVVKVRNNNIVIVNPTPYIVTVANLHINGKQIPSPGNISPRSILEVPQVSVNVREVSMSNIDDYGAISNAIKFSF